MVDGRRRPIVPGNQMVEQYLRHNRTETLSYQKYVEQRCSEKKALDEKKANEYKLKVSQVHSKMRVKKTVVQDILPKYFLAKIQEKKDIDATMARNHKPSESNLDTLVLNERKDINGSSLGHSNFRKNESSKESDLPTLPRVNFGNELSGLGFSKMIHKKQNLAIGAGMTLELKDRSGKGTKPINCAREGFTMVMTRCPFLNQPKDIWVLGGIGSDIIKTLDQMNLPSKIISPKLVKIGSTRT